MSVQCHCVENILNKISVVMHHNIISLDSLGTQSISGLMTRLRDMLVAIRGTPDTPSKAEYVKEYVLSITATSIQSGQQLDDLKQQLHKLHKEELLFSEDVLKKALALAEEEHMKCTEVASVKPAPAKLVAREPLFSMDTVYHSDICCRVLATGDAGNYQSLFKKLPNGQGHSFKAVSMSRSKTERLLIAEQRESLFYFAFQSRPQISDWKDYKSFDEGKCGMYLSWLNYFYLYMQVL